MDASAFPSIDQNIYVTYWVTPQMKCSVDGVWVSGWKESPNLCLDPEVLSLHAAHGRKSSSLFSEIESDTTRKEFFVSISSIPVQRYTSEPTVDEVQNRVRRPKSGLSNLFNPKSLTRWIIELKTWRDESQRDRSGAKLFFSFLPYRLELATLDPVINQQIKTSSLNLNESKKLMWPCQESLQTQPAPNSKTDRHRVNR